MKRRETFQKVGCPAESLEKPGRKKKLGASALELSEFLFKATTSKTLGSESESEPAKNEQRLPDEILLKVVEEHLPLVSLCRFRCVCKAWKTPRLTPAAFRSTPLYLGNEYESEKKLRLYDKQEGNTYTLGCRAPNDSDYYPLSSPCFNGLVAFAKRSDDIRILDIFCLSSSWTLLPPKPPTPNGEHRRAVFAAMSSKTNQPLRRRLGSMITSESLDNYLFVVAMARMHFLLLDRYFTDMVLQVFSGGKWSNSCVIPFPVGYTFFESGCDVSLSVLHGSVFYFLVRSVNESSVKLCSVEVPVPGKQLGSSSCKVIRSSCYSDIRVQGHCYSGVLGVGVCSGKVLLVQCTPNVADNKVYTLKVQMLGEGGEELRLVSCSQIHRIPERICFGVDEVLCFTVNTLEAELGAGNYNLRYKLPANTWEKVLWRGHSGFLNPISYL